MPVVFIEAPPGIRTEAKKKMVERITTAIDEAYHIGDTLIFLREYRRKTLQWTEVCNRTTRDP
jgi:phenylpyruvate tautomerase PptA (4-oxalocrotonate tautomerase family)